MVPLWQERFKSKQEAYIHIFELLKENQQRIIGKGFTPELKIQVGSMALVLKGRPNVKSGKKD